MSEIFVSKAALTEAVFLSMHDNPHKDGKIRHNHNMEHHHFIHMIYHAPAADVVPVVHGRWVKDNYTHKYRCSICNIVQPYDSCEDIADPDNVIFDYWECNYCPNCGAKMDLEREGIEE